ncbi:MAG: ABC transporter ATP-binding protein, partial [Planctomycetota bacterium]
GRQSVKALDGLDFQVRRGEVFGLLGPNGSGKTTTVRIVLGLLFPTSGAVQLFGKSPRDVDVKKRVGYMPEESHLYSYLDAEETLDFFGRLFRLPPAERRHRTEALMDMVGLQRARTRPVGQFSKGMARRIALAQSLINDPDLLILDEPTTGLDPLGTREIKDLILTLRERGKTILLCSHLLGDVEEVCDRICILYGGRERAMGPVGELLAADDVTQITAPRLGQETLSRILKVIRESTGDEGAASVSTPTKRLEEFFLSVIEEARRERLSTAGAERGTRAAAFLGAADEAEQLLEDLVEAGRRVEEPAAEREEAPVAAMPIGRDQEFIEDLVGAARAETPQPEPAEEPTAAVSPETSVQKDVLEELLDHEGGDEKSDEGQTA